MIQNDDELREIICDDLRRLNFNFSYYGTRYLIDSIYETYNQNKIYEVNLVKDIYPILAKKYHKNIDTIHSNIKKSINMMFYDCSEKDIMIFFKYYDIKKPTAKEIIIKVLENIENKKYK